MKGVWGIGLAMLAFGAGLVPAAAQADCSPGKPAADHIVIHNAAELSRVNLAQPQKLWIGGEEPQSAQPLELSAAQLRGLNLAPDSVLVAIKLTDPDLTGWKARGVHFLGVDASEAHLAGADLSGACFDHGSLEHADLSRVKAAGLVLDGTDLTHSVWRGADLQRARLLCEPGLVGEGCGFGEPDDAVDLTDARLEGADLAGPAEALGVVLTGATLADSRLPLTDDLFKMLKPARLTSVELMPVSLRIGKGERFTAAELADLERLSGGRIDALLDLPGRQPGFDCAAAKGPVETRLCDHGDLPALDRLLSLTFRRLSADPARKDAMQASQRAFLTRRNACAANGDKLFECLVDAYQVRLTELALLFDTKALLGVDGASRTDSADPAAPRAKLKDQLLVQRITSAYGQGGDQAALVRKGEAIQIDAGAIGANGHSCSYQADLTRDPKLGIWLDPSDSDGIPWLILPDGTVNVGVGEVARNFCGARASWPMVFFRLPG